MHSNFHPQFMDRHLQSALENWPNQQNLHGWLALDARGRWRLQGEPIRHEGWNRLIGENYFVADCGCWYYLHGKQYVWVDLAYTPWVYHLAPQRIYDHRGITATTLQQLWIDETGLLSFETERGPGLVHDSNLNECLIQLVDEEGSPLSDDTIESRLHRLNDIPNNDVVFQFAWQNRSYPVKKVEADLMPKLLYFKRNPLHCNHH